MRPLQALRSVDAHHPVRALLAPLAVPGGSPSRRGHHDTGRAAPDIPLVQHHLSSSLGGCLLIIHS